MKKINLIGLEMDCYTETLENGLEVFMVPYDNKKNYFISFATRFGSDVLEFTDENNNTYIPPKGIAHFLEHKMFEQASGEDPFTFFSKSGTESNASTSYDNTGYICYGTKEFGTNLRFLLHFVMSPYFTDQNVEKEKGIIAEEIKMYDDMKEFALEMKIRECIYKDHSRRYDIAGTVPEIEKITKEDLYNCYNNFYIPNNMFVLIVGNFKKEEALNIIKEEIGYKKPKTLPKIKKQEEQPKVNEKEGIIKSNIEIPKLAFALKIPTKNLKLKDLELDLYLSMLTTILFGSSSAFRDRVRQEKLLSGMYTECEQTADYRVFYLMASTVNPDELLKEIEKELTNIKISEKTMNRIKKVWISSEIRMIDSIDATVNNLYDDIIKYKKIIPNKIDRIKTMDIQTLKDLIKEIDFKNTSVVKMIKDNN